MSLKEIAEVALIPIAIAGVGGWATIEATRIQEEHAIRTATIQESNAERLAKIQADQALTQHIEGKDVDVAELFLTLLTRMDGFHVKICHVAI